MKVKHSKYKNTGILFELLTRQLTADTIAGNNPRALSIIKKYFSGNSSLLKEYKRIIDSYYINSVTIYSFSH